MTIEQLNKQVQHIEHGREYWITEVLRDVKLHLQERTLEQIQENIKFAILFKNFGLNLVHNNIPFEKKERQRFEEFLHYMIDEYFNHPLSTFYEGDLT